MSTYADLLEMVYLQKIGLYFIGDGGLHLCL